MPIGSEYLKLSMFSENKTFALLIKKSAYLNKPKIPRLKKRVLYMPIWANFFSR